MKKNAKKSIVLVVSAAMTASTFSPVLIMAEGTELNESAINAAEFAEPGMEYRPGVRWWWPGGAAKTEDLIAQIEYLAENNFGTVEINPFNNGFVMTDAVQEDLENILNYDTPEYYKKLKAVVAAAAEKGITVDLNIGSGYCASDDSVQQEDTMGNMGLGRTTISVAEDGVGTELTQDVPPVEISSLYLTQLTPFVYAYCAPNGTEGTWTGTNAKLQAVIISKIVSTEGANIIDPNAGMFGSSGEDTDTDAEPVPLNFYDPETKEVTKSYTKQYVLDPEKTTVIPVDQIQDGKITFTPDEAGDYEIIGLYNEDSNSVGLTELHYNSEKRDYVVDHLDADAVATYVKNWIEGNDEYPSDLHTITEEYGDTLRAAFNDSYEFHNDNFYNDKIYEAASDSNNILGYDFSKYLPIMYDIGSANFNLGMVMDPENPEITYQTTANNPLTYDLTEDEISRIKYDFQQLIDQAFQSGMESFSKTLANYGLVYRQQAYNPPIDTLKSSKYVDIPETEGLDELQLKRVTSGAHLYGKNLITSEVYTLGSTPYTLTPSFIKEGYDLMATSGVTNFFYHGLNATYYGTDEQKEAGVWGEEGWRAWPTIGIETNETDSLSGYYKTLNMYSARNNYVMQSGSQSADVAVYMPLFGSIEENDTITTLNTEGYLYDVMNDDVIQNELSTENGKLTVTASGITYDALIIDKQSLPTATMESLEKLSEEGANIVFFGDLPNRQPSYLDGAYQEADAHIDELSADMQKQASVKTAATVDELKSSLSEVVAPEITYTSNEQVRMNRRTLESGGEVAYIRNMDQENSNIVEIQISENLCNGYLLDQNTGKIYNTDISSGTLSLELKPDASIILLCETEGNGYTDAEDGKPEALVDTVSSTVETGAITLTVTADNIGTNIPADAAETKVYEGDVLGDWGSATFQNGELKYVSDEGIYNTTFTIDDLAPYTTGEKALVLNLGETKYAAEIIVNGINLGQLVYAPYERDITSALTEGENTLEIHVQPLRSNRRVGLKEAYEADPEANAKYEYYSKTVGAAMGDAPTVMGGGIVGPLSLNIIE